MDLAAWDINWQFFAYALNIIVINLILSGDNAVVIAMAVRSLPRRHRKWGIILGAGTAVVLRVFLTFCVAWLMKIQLIKLIGGVLIVGIAVKLFVAGCAEREECEVHGFLQAMWIILVADLTMSLDNVLAVAAASHGNLFLLIFGLTLSIPLVVFSSNLLSELMDRYPIILYIGAAILGRVAAEMIFSDPAVVGWFAPPPWFSHAMEAIFAVGVIAVGKLWLWLAFRRAEALEQTQELGTSGDSLKAQRPERG